MKLRSSNPPKTSARPRAGAPGRAQLQVTVHPLTAERWRDLEALFGPRGAYAGCWCMFFRLPRAEWSAGCGEGNKAAFRRIVKRGAEPGLLAYDGATPVGWCAIAPREEYGGLARSRILKPVDDRPVWSVTCFFVARAARRKGVTVALLEAAAKFVAQKGGSIVEGYPAEPAGGAWPDAYAYHGTVAAFTKAGYVEVARPSKTRAIMRRRVRPARKATGVRA